MQNINKVMKDDPFVQLVQQENFVGWVYNIDYDTALIMTNDLWKAKVLGIPHNCFLVAASFKPDEFAKTPEVEREIILLRVIGSCRLPQDDELVRTKIDYFRSQTDIFSTRDYDALTQDEIQVGGLECRVIGTFFKRDSQLWLGSDLESFATATRLNVYRPRGKALDTIVNYVDPIRRAKAQDEAKQLGIQQAIKPFKLGTVRYTSTDRLHRQDKDEHVPVTIQPSDFLARRTAVLGMTRTGKSNMVKQTVAVVKRVADESGVKIGQIIYDLNGEYANANQQDDGAIADVYPDDTIRYRMLQTKGFEELQNNFYLQLNEGFAIIRRIVQEQKNDTQTDVALFLNTSFDEPDKKEINLHKRWKVRVAAYQAMLHLAGFPAPSGYKIKFDTNKEVIERVQSFLTDDNLKNKLPNDGLTLAEAAAWFLAARKANLEKIEVEIDGKKEKRDNPLPSSTKGKNWLDDDTAAILNMMARENSNKTFIKGYNILTDVRSYHSPRRNQEVGDEIYQHLLDGKIVILDLSVGDPELRERISQQIAREIFNKSMHAFVTGNTPPNIVVYIEEAHNLIGKNEDLTNTWPRLAKEGAKYRIALVYATQEVSSVHPNILSNTENWFITHLNNDREVKELAKFYDFADFSRSLIRAQDVGFARVKTLSSPFVIPVQIDKFDPQVEIERQKKLQGNPTSKPTNYQLNLNKTEA